MKVLMSCSQIGGVCAYVCSVAREKGYGKHLACKGDGSGRRVGVCMCKDMEHVRTWHMYVHGTCSDKGICCHKRFVSTCVVIACVFVVSKGLLLQRFCFAVCLF